jgi:hypothetical protein
MNEQKDDHGRVVTSGAWWGTIGFTAVMAWLSSKVPYAVAWTLNTAVVVTVSYAMARWKRAWYAWAAFWGIAGVAAPEPGAARAAQAGLAVTMGGLITLRRRRHAAPARPDYMTRAEQALKEIRRDAARQAQSRDRDESEEGSAAWHLADDALKALRNNPARARAGGE